MTASGQLYAFGENAFGQLGSSANSGTGTPNPTPTLVTLPGEVGPVTQVAAGTDHSLAVTASGQLYAFGDNAFGQLGSATNNGTDSPNPTPTLVRLASGTTIDTVAKGEEADHSLVIVSDLAITTSALPAAQAGSSYQRGADRHRRHRPAGLVTDRSSLRTIDRPPNRGARRHPHVGRERSGHHHRDRQVRQPDLPHLHAHDQRRTPTHQTPPPPNCGAGQTATPQAATPHPY